MLVVVLAITSAAWTTATCCHSFVQKMATSMSPCYSTCTPGYDFRLWKWRWHMAGCPSRYSMPSAQLFMTESFKEFVRTDPSLQHDKDESIHFCSLHEVARLLKGDRMYIRSKKLLTYHSAVRRLHSWSMPLQQIIMSCWFCWSCYSWSNKPWRIPKFHSQIASSKHVAARKFKWLAALIEALSCCMHDRPYLLLCDISLLCNISLTTYAASTIHICIVTCVLHGRPYQQVPQLHLLHCVPKHIYT